MIITTTKDKKWIKGKELDASCNAKIHGCAYFGEEKQTVRGFGGCFNELGAVALETLSENDRDEVNKALFSSEGCGFDFGRVSIGANDFALDWYSCNETDGDFEMKNFSLDRDRLHIIPYIKGAQKYSKKLSLFASPWSPPAWMKTSKNYCRGQLTDTPENLAAYALYFRKFVEEYKKEGINISQIHIQNEPFAQPIYPSCEWSGEMFRKFIADYLSKSLDEVSDIFLGTINGPETDERALSSRYSQYAGYVMQDETCQKCVKGVSYQWAGKAAVQQTHDDYPELELIQSESECGDGKNTWEYAMYIFEMIRHYFRNGISAYIYWNMVLSDSCVSSWGWSQNSMITVKDKKVIYNPEFYVMKHVASFVKSGAKYLEMNGNWSSNCVAFKNPDGQTVVAVLNPYDEEKNVNIGGKLYVLPTYSFNTVII